MSDKNVTAYKLCKDLKIHSGLFSSMKDGKTRWQIEILMEIAKYFEVSLDSIAFGFDKVPGSNGKGQRDGKFEDAKIRELKQENEKLKSELKKYRTIKKQFENLN